MQVCWCLCILLLVIVLLGCKSPKCWCTLEEPIEQIESMNKKTLSLLQLEWVSQAAPDSLPRPQTSKIQEERPEGDAAAASSRALTEGSEGDDGKASTSESSGDAGGASKDAARERPMGGASSNVVPKESVARAAISIAAAGNMSSEDRSTLQQGQWVTASFDDLPDR